MRRLYNPGGGGVLSIFVLWGICRFSGYRFGLFFLGLGIKEGKVSGAGCQNMSKEEILLQRVILESNFCVFVYTFYRFFLEQGII